MNIFLFLYLIIAFAFILAFFSLKNKVKQRIIVLSCIAFCFVVVSTICVYFLYDGVEKSIYIMTENHERIEIKLDNVKDYNFYRFSTDLSTEELLEEVKETYDNAYYDKTENKVVFEHNDVEYEIENEGMKKILWIRLYKYLFAQKE